MLKTLIIATVLLPKLAIAQQFQQLPQPRQPGQWCPAGWMANGRRLSKHNRKDLKESASTLAADGTLQPACKLVRVETKAWDVCPEPTATRIHPKFNEYRLCRPFNMGKWVLEAAERAAEGTIEDREREALYKHILLAGADFPHRILASIRRSPVVKDHRGSWVAPQALALLPSHEAALLSSVVSAPAPELENRTDLLNRLRVRRKLSADDFLHFAGTVAANLKTAAPFEDLLNRHQRLITPKIAVELSSVVFLRSRAGDLAAPTHLHLATRANLALLGNSEAVVGGANNSLYRRLKVRAHPSSDTLLEVLARLRDSGVAPACPETLYPALATALRIEKVPPTAHVDDAILWVNGSYHSPHETLVGSHVPRCFQLALPVFRGLEAVARAYEDLGASIGPSNRHWLALFQWFDDHAREHPTSVLRPTERNVLREAYLRRGKHVLPDGLPETALCLLSANGTLHSMRELRGGTFLENDYPQLADALATARAKLAFADMAETSRTFFAHLGLERLSAVCGIPDIITGAECAPPNWFKARHEAEILALFKRPDFAVALHQLGWALASQAKNFRPVRLQKLERRLAMIQRITFVSEIERVYVVAGTRALVSAEAAVCEDRIALLAARNRSEHDQMLAPALAEVAGAKSLPDARPLALSILPLLRCRSNADMLSFLLRQGIKPRHWSEVDDNSMGGDGEEGELDPQTESVMREIGRSLRTKTFADVGEQSTGAQPIPVIATRMKQTAAPLVLPPLDTVPLAVIERSGSMVIEGSSSGGGPATRRTTAWSPPSPSDVERDRVVGERGEALVYRMEIERVRSMGFDEPEKHVTWTSKTDQGADHDIRSIDEHGNPRWIEVKSSMGTDGRFEWPRNEFEKALRERRRYELWRIYQAHTQHPTAKSFRDPAFLVGSAALRLELSALRACVESKD